MTPSQVTGSPLSDRIVDLLAQVPIEHDAQMRALALLHAFRRQTLRDVAACTNPDDVPDLVEAERRALVELLEELLAELKEKEGGVS